MGANFNPNTVHALGTIFSGVNELLQAARGGGTAQPVQQPAQAPAQQPAVAAPPVDQFQAPAQPAPAALQGPTQPAAQPPAGDLSSKIQQLVQMLSSVIQMIQGLLGGGQAAGGAGAGAGAGAGGAAANAAAGAATATANAAAGGAQASASASAAASGGDSFSALQQQFGAWHGKGKNSDAPTGPNAKRLVAEAQSALSSGDTSTAQQKYSEAQKTSSPVMLDLNHDGKLGTTGVSTAKNRADGQTGKMVDFDIDGDGKKDKVEWMDGKGDGMLVDDKNGAVTRAAGGNGEINGNSLFGDQGGKFGSGYDKMAKYDTNGDGKLTGAELQGIKVWVDNGDAKVQQGELKSLAELGITELNVGNKNVANGRGESLNQSTFTQNGKQYTSEDVWFANGNKKA